MKISVCLIVKNEEKHLDKCLQSVVNYVDEIIITDTGSNDKTVEIAEKYTDNIFHYKWDDNFAAARNFCQQYATGDYILWLDADEYFEENYILQLVTKINQIDSKVLFIHIFIINIVLGYEYSTNNKLKIIKNNCGAKWIWKTHEIIDYYNNNQDTSITYDDIFFIHDFQPKGKKWYDIESYLELFKKDKNNSNLALDLMKYYIQQKQFNNINYILEEIGFIHPGFIRRYTELLKNFNNLNLEKQKTTLSKLLKNSLVINERKYKRDSKLIY